MTGSPATLIEELENSLEYGSDARRAETLRQVTDLFLTNVASYSDEQTCVFDDVFEVLVRKIEVSAKVLLAQRLAPVPTAPPRVVHTLAFDDAIEVAAPILALSERLSDEALVENARTKSQAHLLAISSRSVLSSTVTDALVERGDSNVVSAVVGNTGAELSEQGYGRLLELSERDDDLATCVGTRPSIPRHHFVKLIARASRTVRSRLEALNAQSQSSHIASAVDAATAGAQRRSAAEDARMVAANALVERLNADGQLDGDQIAAFANANRFEETNAALALLASVPVSTVEALMVKSRSEGVMILTKVVDLPWMTVKAILQMRAALSGEPAPDFNFCKVSYGRLKPATAQQVLRFHHTRKRAG